MHPLQKNPHTKMSAFSGASQCRISQETMVTMFSHPSSLTRLCSKRCNVIPNMINITILRKGKTMILKKSKEKRKQFQSTRKLDIAQSKEKEKALFHFNPSWETPSSPVLALRSSFGLIPSSSKWSHVYTNYLLIFWHMPHI